MFNQKYMFNVKSQTIIAKFSYFSMLKIYRKIFLTIAIFIQFVSVFTCLKISLNN